MIYFCSQKNRRALVLASQNLNGIDYLEVAEGSTGCGKQLLITMLKDARSLHLTPSQVQITGGAEASQVTVASLWNATQAAPTLVTVQLNQTGDFSTYTLSLVATPTAADPPGGIDPQLSSVDFSFKAGCPTVADCQPCNCCPPDTTPEPDINYLAKDFGGFRQVMLDRMAVLAPTWNETHAADIGMTLVEILAYAADHLSYQQDAVGTEAYLATARSRISLRRLAKLVDYQIGEGSNARTWVYLFATQDGVTIPSGTLVFPTVPGFPVTVRPNTTQATTLLSSPLGFATLHDVQLCQEQNEMHFYTWGDADCCLATGATSATLIPKPPNTGNLNTLKPGDVLIFEEVMGPNTGDPEDANPNNRWAVRLTEVRTNDYLGNPLVDPLFSPPIPITEITWAEEDALPFPLCVSSTSDAEHSSTSLTAVSVARGNIVLADHGVWQVQTLAGTVALSSGSAAVTGTGTIFTNSLQVGQWLVFASDLTQTPYQISAIANDTSLTLAAPFAGANALATAAAMMEDLGQVPAAPPAPIAESSCACTCEGSPPAPLPRYYPELAQSPVTFAWPNDASAPASTSLVPAATVPSPVLPQIAVYDNQGEQWSVIPDLLSSNDSQRVCVLEIESTGAAFLRFGDDQYGMAPEPGMDFQVRYRVGNGTAGNIGRDSLGHILTSVQGVGQVRNPLAAAGGVDAETSDHIRQVAPYAFRTQLRAVTEDDYGVMAEQNSAIREARGTLRWTGSWYTAFVSIDPADSSGPTAALVTATERQLNLLRMMGVDLAVEGAVIVGLRIEMNICVDPGFFRGDVQTALMELFTTRNQCTGQPGLLNPANFTFGETIYTSPFIAAAQGVEGVTSVAMTAFQRMDDPSTDGVAVGYLTMGRLEIARCDNDPNRMDNGVFVLHMDGGK